MRLSRQEFSHFRNDLAQVEVFGFHIQFAGFDLGKIEDVIDDGEQGFRRGAHRLGVIPLLRSESGVEQQGGHAEDAVHRGADLVTDVGDEFGLDSGGAFNFLGMQRCAAGDQEGDGDAGKNRCDAESQRQQPGFPVGLGRLSSGLVRLLAL